MRMVRQALVVVLRRFIEWLRRTGPIPGSGSSTQSTGPRDFDPDRPKRTVERVVGGRVPNRVLASNLARDIQHNPLDVVT